MEGFLRRIYSSRNKRVLLKIISHASVAISVISFVYILVSAYIKAPILSVKILFLTAIPYFIVTMARKIINAPRPYELYDFYEEQPKKKTGSSFPSRHVFSAFTIATLAACFSPWLAVLVYVAGVMLAVARVLLGIHFIRDVTAGALIGILSGIIGIIIIL